MNRFEKESLYQNPAYASLYDRYGANEHDLTELHPGSETSILIDADHPNFAIGLGHVTNRWPKGWLDINLNKGQRGEHHEAMELDVISQQRIHLGHSALLDTVTIGDGDAIRIGRRKYPGLSANASRDHVAVSVEKSEEGKGFLLHIADLNSQNGTMVIQSQLQGEGGNEDAYQIFESDETLNDVFEESLGTPETSLSPLNELAAAFVQVHRAEFPLLSDADLTLCYTVCADIAAKHVNDRNNKAMMSEYYRVFHPDRLAHSDEAVRHQLFLLGKRILNLA